MDSLAITGIIFANKDLVNKLLGPSCEYLGDKIKDKIVRKGLENIENIFSKAYKKLGNKINEPGKVNSRILQSILTTGSFCEDELIQEYLAGALALSRTKDGTDDSVIGVIKIIESLSSIDLRLHYILYTSFYEKCKNQNLIIEDLNMLKSYSPFIPIAELKKEFFYESNVCMNSSNLLNSKNLIDFFGFDDTNPLEITFNRTTDDAGLIFTPTLLGIRLFFTLHGTDFSDNQIFKNPIDINNDLSIDFNRVDILDLLSV